MNFKRFYLVGINLIATNLITINSFVPAVKNVDLVFFPGVFVKKSNYLNLANNIKEKLENDKINSTIHIIDSFDKSSALKSLINNNVIKNKVHIIGHSGGACDGAYFCDKTSIKNKVSSFIQLYADFNLDEQHPYMKTNIYRITNPTLTILAELDDRLPFSDAILDKELLSKKDKLVVMKDFGHFSGINTNSQDENKLSNVISDYIKYIENNDTDAKQNIMNLEEEVSIRYNDYLRSIRNVNIRDIIENIEKKIFNYTNYNIHANIYSRGNNLFETLFEIMNGVHKNLIYHFRYLPLFVFSHPRIDHNQSSISTSVFIPYKNSVVSFINQKRLTNSPFWFKLKKNDDCSKNIGKKITTEIIENVIDSLDIEIRKEYLKNNKIIDVGNDINIPLFPFCSLLWLHFPLILEYKNDSVIVHPVVLQTPPNVPLIFGGESTSNSLNIKTISEAQILEWILIKSKF